MSLLSIRDLSVTYSGKRNVKALSNFSLDIQPGESWGIVGESGSGKTTLIMALMRLLPKSAMITGKALFEDNDLISLPDTELRKIRWQQMALVFQKSMNALSPVHRVGEFMQDIYKVHMPDKGKHEVRERIESLLQLVNLPVKVYNLYPHELSGGMMQRVSIALSLLFDPKLLILDEATTALDVITQNQILEEIMELEAKLGITRIMVTHDISVVASSCKNIAVLYAGRLLEAGTVEAVLVNPKHPYTKGLIGSFPSLADGEHRPLAGIPGNLPDLASPPPGCIFAPRCNNSSNLCHNEAPGLTVCPDNQLVYCHRANALATEGGGSVE